MSRNDSVGLRRSRRRPGGTERWKSARLTAVEEDNEANHICPCDHATLQDHCWSDAKVLRRPEDEIGELSDRDVARNVRDTVQHRRIDRVLRDVSLHTHARQLPQP